MTRPTRYSIHTLKSTGERLNFVGTGELLKDGEEPREVLMFVRVVSGFEEAQRDVKEGKTNFLICDEEDWKTLFEPLYPNGELSLEAQARAERESKGE